MSVAVPILLPVYHRRTAAEPYAFQHMARGAFMKRPPRTLRVTDLRQHDFDDRRERAVARAGLLLLATGDQAIIYTLDNWNQPKTPFLYHGVEFPAVEHPHCAELEDDYSLIPIYTTLTHFTHGPTTDCTTQLVASATLEAGGIVIPHVLPVSDLPQLRENFGHAYSQSTRAATWVVDGEPYNEATREPKRRRLGIASPSVPPLDVNEK